ncbi:MAG TPA: hypothetical protein VF476_06820 [Chitinophagaceae bacterium]
MRILISLCAAMLLLSPAVFAQSYEGSIEYDKKKQRAFVIEYNYSPEAVENAIINKMDKLGYKGKEEKGLFNKDKGFRVYKGANINDITNRSMDYIIRVERKSKKNDDASLLYIIINTKEGDNAMQVFDEDEIRRAKGFLNNLQPEVEAADLELQITAQEGVVVKAEKKLKNLKDDKSDMEKKIQKLQDDIKKNEKDQEDAQKDIENQKLNLEGLRGKRKSSI